MLCTKKQDVLYNLFEWPYKKNSKWIVIAIANAMNLPEQILTNKISSRLGLTRLNFQPYTFQELQEIVTCRLRELNIFDVDAIIYASRKVAAVSGDARRALEICRRATELAENEDTFVNINHVDLSIKQMFSSSKIVFLKSATKYEQLFLKAITILYKSTGSEETQLNKIFEQFVALCKYDNIAVINRTQLLNICNMLASCKLILIEPSKTISVYMQRIRLNMSVDDIEYALKN
jgi:Cdc6-like AAA superfamily ATPase